MKTALYDLSNRPASFDYVTFLSTAKAYGCDHVRLVLKNGWKKKNYTLEQAKERYASIVEPAAALFGMSYSVGDREGVEYSHFFDACMKAYRDTGKAWKIIVPAEPKDYVTITLRKSRTPERDSNEEEWRKFARMVACKVIILRDWDETPIDLHDRMRLYAGARMNFMVINGPLTLCIHSDAPYLSMRTIGCANSGSTSPAHMSRIGITPGFQFPWANANQRLSYLDDTAENVMLEWENMLRERKAA